MRRLCIVWTLSALALFLGSGPARADGPDWLSDVFPERNYDFGTVARGSQIRHSFVMVNRTNSDIRIATWRTKCGCTEVRVGARLLPPGTQTTIEATINTTNFVGPKPSGLVLVLDQPTWAEVDLNVNCYIRGDITTNPGAFDFGAVRRSAKLPSSTLTLTYAGGRSDWGIVKMKTQTSKVKAEARELGRTFDGQAQWQITATLQPGVTNGYLKDQVTLITNDTPPQSIPISVAANIQSGVTVAPSIVNLGRARPGQTVTKANIVHVRSSIGPFKLTTLEPTRPELEVTEPKAGPSQDHIINLTFKAPTEPGPFHAYVKIESDLKDEPPIQLKVFATVVSETKRAGP